MSQPRSVLLALGAYDYRVHRGVVSYARQAGWHLTAPPGHFRRIPWGWEGDGIIAGSGGSEEFVEFLAAATVPVIDLSWRHPELTFPRVLSDNHTIGKQAADHFRARGFRNFLFLAARPSWYEAERFAGFSDALQKAGHTVSHADFPPDGTTWLEHRKWTLQQIRKCSLPLAILCSDDYTAGEVVDICRHNGLVIPDQVAIVGIGNYRETCETLSIKLSSIDNNPYGQGQEAAALLARYMDGETLPRTPYRVPSRGLIVRASSDIYAVTHPRVARAVRFIHEHYGDPIGVPDIAAVARMSRQGLNKAFRNNLGRTPGEELRRIRLMHARRLLMETEWTLDRIADAVGYSSANSLCIVFQRAFGHTPSSLRTKRAQAPRHLSAAGGSPDTSA